MGRSTTVRVVNGTRTALALVDMRASAGRWSTQADAAQLPPGATATFVNSASGRFGSANGTLAFQSPSGRTTLRWSNPFLGRNSYRMEVDDPSVGCVCDGDDDDSDTVVSFTAVPSRKVAVPGFLPSTSGFKFTNSWSGEPLKRINLKFGSVPLGRASNGLCGGMAYAARDWYEARRQIPPDLQSPPDGSPFREYVIGRLIDSFDLPAGVVPYATLMSSRYPDHDGDILAALGQLPSRASILARRTWPAVKAVIDTGHPCPLGLVMVVSDDPEDLGHHHQVLAYGYQIRGSRLSVRVYDPNSPGDDGVVIGFDTARTDRSIEVDHNIDVGGPLVCAFVPRYVAVSPPLVV